MNALGGIGAGIMKAIGPLFVGVWMAFCFSLDAQDDSKREPTGSMLAWFVDTRDDIKNLPLGSLLAWIGIAFVSGLGMFFVLKTL